LTGEDLPLIERFIIRADQKSGTSLALPDYCVRISHHNRISRLKRQCFRKRHAVKINLLMMQKIVPREIA